MRDPITSKLIFPEGHDSDGFEKASTTKAKKGNPEPFTRELLQNCLDAQFCLESVEELSQSDNETAGSVKITISIRNHSITDLPALNSYKFAFNQAASQREAEGELSPSEEGTVRRIRRSLGKEQGMRVLFCRDDGHGLNIKRMTRILSESNTSKTRSHGGAGSVGLGHLTTFPSSNLRYVCYGGKYREDGQLNTIVSGRAILASHLTTEDGKKTMHSPNGTLALNLLQREKLSDPGFTYLTQPPLLMEYEMNMIGNSTGSVVAVCGFDDFGEETSDDTVETIAKIAVSHFLVAIKDNRMIIEINDEVINESVAVDSSTIEDYLDPDGSSSASKNKGVSFAPKLVHRAYTTLCEGKQLKSVGGATLLYRALPNGEKPTQVNIFRDGMWITNKAYKLNASNFKGLNPFDAVLLSNKTDPNTELYDLIRSSEGADHMEIDLKSDQLKPHEINQLKTLLMEIAKILKEEAGEIPGETYSPPSFAVFTDGNIKNAEILQRIPISRQKDEIDEASAREPDFEEELELDVVGPGPGPSPNPGPGPSPNPGPRPEPPARPRSGKRVEVPCSLRPNLDGTGKTLGVQIWIPEHNYGDLGARVYANPGSDLTCETLLPPQYQSIIGGTDAFELLIIKDSHSFYIEFDKPFVDSARLEVELVER